MVDAAARALVPLRLHGRIAVLILQEFKVVSGMKVNADACRAAFTPGVFATDVALKKVAAGTPWRDAYHEVRDQFAALYEGKDAEVANLDPDKQVALKTHEGTCMGIDHDLYQQRISAAAKSAEIRKAALEAKCKALLK